MPTSNIPLGVVSEFNGATSTYYVTVSVGQAETLAGIHFDLSYDADALEYVEGSVTGLVGLPIVGASDGIVTVADAFGGETFGGTVTLGFDGSSREVYEAHRVRCSYDRVLANMRRFLAMRNQFRGPPRLVVKYVMTRDNRHEMESAREMWAEHLVAGRDRFQVMPSENWATACLDRGDRVLQKAGSPIGRLRPCPLLFFTMNVLYDGAVPACCWDYNLDVFGGALGDARQESLYDIWHGAVFEKLRARSWPDGIKGALGSRSARHGRVEWP